MNNEINTGAYNNEEDLINNQAMFESILNRLAIMPEATRKKHEEDIFMKHMNKPYTSFELNREVNRIIEMYQSNPIEIEVVNLLDMNCKSSIHEKKSFKPIFNKRYSFYDCTFINQLQSIDKESKSNLVIIEDGKKVEFEISARLAYIVEISDHLVANSSSRSVSKFGKEFRKIIIDSVIAGNLDEKYLIKKVKTLEKKYVKMATNIIKDVMA